MNERKRICLGCNQTKQMTDGMFLCDDCRAEISMYVTPTGRVEKGKKPPELLSYLVKTDFFGDHPKMEENGVDDNELSVFVKAFLESADVDEVCKKLSVSSSTVNNIFQKFNIRPWMHDMQCIIRGEHEGGATEEELAKKYGFTAKAIDTLLHKDFRVRMPGDIDKRRRVEMRRLYFSQHMTQAEIARVYDCSPLKVMYVCGQDWLDEEG